MSKQIIEARANVIQARIDLIDTARELQQRLQPRTLVREAWESAKVKGADMAEEAVDAVKNRPVVTGGVIAAIAMFLAREPIKDGVGRLVDAMTSDKDKAPKRPPVRSRTSKVKPSAPRKPRKTEIK